MENVFKKFLKTLLLIKLNQGQINIYLYMSLFLDKLNLCNFFMNFHSKRNILVCFSIKVLPDLFLIIFDII